VYARNALMSSKAPKKNGFFVKMAILRKKGFLWLKRNEKSLIFFFALLLSSTLAFEIGFFAGSGGGKSETLVVERVREDCPTFPLVLPNSGVVQGVNTSSSESKQENCLFVGSVNSDKYHSPTCSYAKRIKPENIRCFSSVQEAVLAGYQEGCIQ